MTGTLAQMRPEATVSGGHINDGASGRVAIPPESPFNQDLDANAANYVPLSPVSFLRRAVSVYPDDTAVIHGETRFTYGQFDRRCRALAAALQAFGVSPGDTISIMAPNTPAMLEAHYAVPGIGAVLNPLNVRLDADTIAFILEHGEAKVLLTDREFSDVIAAALAKLERPPRVIDIDDLAQTGERLGEIEYEDLLAETDPLDALLLPADEWQAMLLSYTSGTTGNPKGVVYHHRGAYLNAMANIAAWAMPKRPVMLWTLPMFHALGWCFPWSIGLLGGAHVCLRKVEPRIMYREIRDRGVTHMCGAPVVLNALINARSDEIVSFPQRVQFMTAASPPPPSIIQQIEERGFDILHVYGMTEVYGPSVICEWQRAWDELPPVEQAQIKSRQGVAYPSVEDLRVVDPETLEDVPRDGVTQGEVVKRANTIMRGYLKNPEATAEAFAGGVLHTGDLAVWHADGYIELRDRSKDIIISGGENISTIEVEAVLYQHPAVLDAAVVARPHETWGETPCAFVMLKDEADLSEDELIAFCRERLAGFKRPRSVVFGPLPKTSTGKVQKFVLRERAAQLGEMSDD
ncbi:MAG: acyl-CoA synthetase [Pseudomonadota bacterium]